MTRARIAATLGLAAALLAPARALAQGCAMCRTALQGSDDPMVFAINTSILFLMAMPYAIVGTVGGWIYLSSRRQRAAVLLAESGRGSAGAGLDSEEGEHS